MKIKFYSFNDFLLKVSIHLDLAAELLVLRFFRPDARFKSFGILSNLILKMLTKKDLVLLYVLLFNFYLRHALKQIIYFRH